jgi:hypothetical protein
MQQRKLPTQPTTTQAANPANLGVAMCALATQFNLTCSLIAPVLLLAKLHALL